MGKFHLFPEQASTLAPEVDHLLYFLLAVAVFFTVLIFGAIFYFAIRYRRRSEQRTAARACTAAWRSRSRGRVIPFGLTMVMFTWGASIFFTESRPPDNAMQIYVVGKQWMWKLQHMEGQREINELHVPVGRPVRLTMTSRGRDPQLLRAGLPHQAGRGARAATPPPGSTPPRRASITCSAPSTAARNHSGMIGWVNVMEPPDYQNWLSGGARRGLAGGERRRSCSRASGLRHLPQGRRLGPRARPWSGLFGSTVQLADGGTVTADDAYIRESILQPQAKIVAGYRAGHADVPGPGHRGGRAATDRVHQVARRRSRAGRQTGAARRQRRTADPPSESLEPYDYRSGTRTRALPERRATASSRGCSPPTTSASPCCTSLTITLFFFLGGAFATLIRLELLTPQGDLVSLRDLQQAVHHARRRDDLLLPDPVDPRRRSATSSCR